MIIKKVNINN